MIERSTKGVAFLATPFRGSDHVEWANTCVRIARLVGQTNQEILTELKKDSQRLVDIVAGFSKLVRGRESDRATRVRVVCFCEELVTSGLGMVSW